MPDDELLTIDRDQLAAITGGASASSDQVTLMLQTLVSEIKDLAASRSAGSSNPVMQLLPVMMMMRNQQQAPAVAEPASPSPDDGWIRVS